MVIIPLLPSMIMDTNISMEIGGLLVTAYAVAYAVSAPIFGSISDRLGRKKMILIGLFVFMIATTFTSLSSTFTVMIIFRILSGIGAGMIEPVVFALVADHYPYEKRGRAIGVVTGALISASIIGVPFGGYIAQVFSWKWTFFVISIISFVIIISISILLPKDTGNNNRDMKSPLKGMLKQMEVALSNKSVLLALLTTLLYYGGLQGLFVNIGVFYNIHFGLSPGQIGLVLMVAGIGSVIGSILGGKLADQFGKKRMIYISTVLVAMFVIILSMTESFIMAFLLNIAWATVYGVGQAALTTLISELSPSARGTVMSLNSSAMYSGSALFTTIAAILLYGGSFLTVGVLCGVVNIIVFFTSRLITTEQTRIDKEKLEFSQKVN